MKRRRPGRPPGPREGRGQEPWDPQVLTSKHRQILLFLAEHLDWRRADVAAYLVISPAHLSKLANCPAGQEYLWKLGVDPTMITSPIHSDGVVNLDEFL